MFKNGTTNDMLGAALCRPDTVVPPGRASLCVRVQAGVGEPGVSGALHFPQLWPMAVLAGLLFALHMHGASRGSCPAPPARSCMA